MGGLDVALGMILALCSLGCLIYLLVRLAQEKGALHAVLGFFFPIYPFFWGWLHAGRLGFLDIMAFWTAVIVIYSGYTLAMGAVTAQSMMAFP